MKRVVKVCKHRVLLRFLCLILGVSGAIGGTGCALAQKGYVAEPTPQVYSLDGVKEVKTNISDASDPSTMLQLTYGISSTSHLLLRLENLSSKVDQVSLSSGNKVLIKIALNELQDLTAAQSAFQICPLSKNWMMLATWSRAYPMGSSGRWQTSGGDFDATECVSVSSTDQKTLSFDVTSWFVNEVKGRGRNYGLVLISSSGSEIVIRGDYDVENSPRIQWMQ